jgi:cell division protein FtsL
LDGVNKVIVEKNKFEINGNTVLAPDESFRKPRYEDLEESRKQTKQSKKLKGIKRKKNVLVNILLVFIVGVTIIARYSMIYNYQDNISKTKAEIDMLGKENDAYKVELIKFRNISYIEEIATQKLHMVKPRISDIQYCNLSKNNLETKEDSEIKISKDIINKIKNIIF